MLLTVLVVSKILYVLGEDIHFHEHMKETLITYVMCYILIAYRCTDPWSNELENAETVREVCGMDIKASRL